jgi:DnaJ family protein A protein 2
MEEPEEQDHYSVLDLTFGATVREIRSAARKLHLRHHPDKGGDVERFRKVLHFYCASITFI